MNAHPLLADRPEMRALLRSGAAALPFGQGFWGELARGMRVEEERVASWVAQLQDARVLEGFWLEPNPDHPAAREALVRGPIPGGPIPGSTVIRWQAGSLASVLVGPGEPQGLDKAIAWHKAAPTPPLDDPMPADFAVEEDRTLFVSPEEHGRTDEDSTPAEEALFRAMSTPSRLDHPATPYSVAAELLGGDADARAALAGCVVKRRARRLSWRVRPAAAGFGGMALAEWLVPVAAASKAAAALARVRLAGDVAQRDPGGRAGARITAVLWGRSGAEAADLARRIGAKWGVEPYSVEEAELA